MTIKSNEDGQTRYVKHYMTDRWFPRIVGSVGRSTYTSCIWINWCEAGVALACSRLRDGGGKSFSNKKCEKRAGAGERQLSAIFPVATAPFPKSCASYFRFAPFNTLVPTILSESLAQARVAWKLKVIC